MTSRIVNLRGAITGAGMVLVAMVGGFEGLQLKAYRDMVGIWTICYGETRNVVAGMVATKPECDAKLQASLITHEQGMRRCLTYPDAMRIEPYIAFVSLTYNIGVAAFCKSTLARKANDNDMAGACDEILRWDKTTIAGVSVTVRGLTRRRAEEHALCRKAA